MTTTNVRVIARFRPINEREKLEGEKKGAKVSAHLSYDDTHVHIGNNDSNQTKSFAFDRVFWNPKTSQKEVYHIAAKETVQDVLNGFNGTIFAYGQTGTGKSFTMFGPNYEEEMRGIIPRSCRDIFDFIDSSAPEGVTYTVKCSFLEIYNEQLKDLLNPKGPPLRIRENGEFVLVENLTEREVKSESDVRRELAHGERHRAVSSTQMNEGSSRSHSLFQLSVQQVLPDGSVKVGLLNLVDLAGSEQVRKTGATGTTLEEAKKINKSLSALGNCIYALSQKRKGHIPYRDSKLTTILRQSLGGNCKTTLLIACSPHTYNLEETLSTLKFGHRAKKLKNEVKQNKHVNVEELHRAIHQTNVELHELKNYTTLLEAELGKIVGLEPNDVKSKLKDGMSLSDLLQKKTETPSPESIAEDNQNLLQTEEELNHLKDRKDSTEHLIKQLTREIETLSHQEQQNKTEIKRLKEQLSSEHTKAETLAVQIKAKEIYYAQLEGKIEEAKAEVQLHAAALKRSEEKNKQMSEEMKRLKESPKGNNSHSEQDEMEELKRQNQELMEQLNKMRQENLKLSNSQKEKETTEKETTEKETDDKTKKEEQEKRELDWKAKMEKSSKRKTRTLSDCRTLNGELRSELSRLKAEQRANAQESGQTTAEEISSSESPAKKTKEDGDVDSLEAKYQQCIDLCQDLLTMEATNDRELDFLHDLQVQQEEEKHRQDKIADRGDHEVHKYLANCFMTMGNIYKAKKHFDEAQKNYDLARSHYQAAFWRVEDSQASKRNSTWERKKRMTLLKVQNMMHELPCVLDDIYAPTVPEDSPKVDRRETRSDSREDSGFFNRWRNWLTPRGSVEDRRKSRSLEVETIEALENPPAPQGASLTASDPTPAPSEAPTPSPLTTSAPPTVSTASTASTESEPAPLVRSRSHEAVNEIVTPRVRSATFHRGSVITEMVLSEKDYVSDLQMIIELFVKPLKENGIISERDISEIFSNLETIVRMNVVVLDQLEERIKNSSPATHRVGDIFQRMGDFFKMYKVYCANQQHAIEKLQTLSQTNPAFKAFLKECAEDPKSRKLSLSSFLIKPVQRICKYPLLFKELVRHTPKDHPDYQSLLEAKKKIEEIVEYVNEGQRTYEAQQRILAIQKNVDGLRDLISPTRRLVREGVLRVQMEPSDRSSEHFVFLFNDLVVFAKRNQVRIISSRDFYLVKKIPIGCVTALSFPQEDSGSNFLLKISPERQEEQHGTDETEQKEPRERRASRADNEDKTFIVSSSNRQESDSWFSSFVRATEDFQTKTVERRSMVVNFRNSGGIEKEFGRTKSVTKIVQ